MSCSHIIHLVWWVVAASLFTLVGQNLHRLLLPTKLGSLSSLSLSLSFSSTHCRMQHNNEWVYLCHWHFIVVWDPFGVYFFPPYNGVIISSLKPVSQTRLHLDSLLLVQQPICKLASATTHLQTCKAPPTCGICRLVNFQCWAVLGF